MQPVDAHVAEGIEASSIAVLEGVHTALKLVVTLVDLSAIGECCTEYNFKVHDKRLYVPHIITMSSIDTIYLLT